MPGVCTRKSNTVSSAARPLSKNPSRVCAGELALRRHADTDFKSVVAVDAETVVAGRQDPETGRLRREPVVAARRQSGKGRVLVEVAGDGAVVVEIENGVDIE